MGEGWCITAVSGLRECVKDSIGKDVLAVVEVVVGCVFCVNVKTFCVKMCAIF